MMQDLCHLEDISDDIVNSILKDGEQTPEIIVVDEEIITCCLEWLDDFVKYNIKLFHHKDCEEHWIDYLEHVCRENYYDLLCENDDMIHNVIEQTIEHYYCIMPMRSRKMSSILYIPNKTYITNILNHLKCVNETLPAQRSTEWYEFRHNLLSASSLWKVFDTDAMQNQLIYEKCQPIQTDKYSHVNIHSPLHWGQKYEPLSIMYYEYMYNTTVSEYGCIQHNKYPFIGASPDGINTKKNNDRYGRMLEIKNVVSRVIDGIPKKEYWIQMQLQMECCDLDECDFLETQFKEFETEEDFWKCEPKVHKGVCLYFVERVSIGQSSSNNSQAPRSNTYPKIEQEEGFSLAQEYSGVPYYEYMPFNIPLTKENVDKWIEDTRARLRRSWSLYTTIYWHLEEYSCILVNRNRLWFEHAIPHIEDTWKTIEKERETGCEHRAPAKKVVKNPLLEVVQKEDGQKELKNFQFQKAVCLVKV